MDYTAWLSRRNVMGIVRLRGRDGVRFVTNAREREGREASSEVRGIGQRPVVVAAPSVDVVAREGERHSAADRTRVRRSPPSGGAARLASSGIRRQRHVHDHGGDLHPAFAAHRTAREVDPGEPMQQHGDRFRLRVLGWWLSEESPAPR